MVSSNINSWDLGELVSILIVRSFRVERTLDEHTADFRFKFIQLSMETSSPLKVSPFLSSTIYK